MKLAHWSWSGHNCHPFPVAGLDARLRVEEHPSQAGKRDAGTGQYNSAIGLIRPQENLTMKQLTLSHRKALQLGFNLENGQN